MNIVHAGFEKARRLLNALPAADPRKDGMFFYQACDLPNFGFVPGLWDHRGSEDVYLARTDFSGSTALDVGPANGFWSFEMERRGAKVTVIELGSNDSWDTVPHAGHNGTAEDMRAKVEAVHADFMTCHKANNSKIEVKRGAAYSTPDLIDKVDIALMGNILQHLRDPFLAIERVASVVQRRIIISESVWIDDEDFMNTARMQLIPRLSTPLVNHSWYQVSPVFVGEILLLLGFVNLKCEIHFQKFNGSEIDPIPRMVKHFTYSGDRP